MADLGFLAFDADNHYYEAEDAFTRHVDRASCRSAACSGPTIDGQASACSSAARSTASSRTRPSTRSRSRACLDEYFRGKNPTARTSATLFGELEPIQPGVPRTATRSSRSSTSRDRGLLPVPDARRRHGGVAEARPRGGCWRRSAASTAGWTRTGASPTATGSSRRRTSRCRPGERGRGARVGARARRARRRDALGADLRPDRRAARSATPSTIRSGRASPRPASPSRSTRATPATTRYADAWGCGGEFESFRYDPLRICLSANADPRHDGRAGLRRRLRAPPAPARRDDRVGQRRGSPAC